LSSLLKISVSGLFIFFQLNASGGDLYGIRAGAGEAGMAFVCTMKEGFWSSFHNQALLAFNSSYSFGANYENRFGLSELATRSAAVIIPAGKSSVGAAFSNFGYHDFRRNNAGLGCGIKLSGKMAAGIQIDYFSENISGEYDNRQIVTFEAGLVFAASENVTAGIHLFNPVPNSLRKTEMPMSINAGAGIRLNSSLFAGVEAEMSTGHNLDIRTGLEYEPVKNLWLRAGYGTNNNSFCFGTGYRYGIARLDLGFSSHDRLGITSAVSVIIQIH
jgi:hypothetical protein